MVVEVISDTVQVFNGKRYSLQGRYLQRSRDRLHRVVWEYHHGPIPDGFAVHHIDHDRFNNQIENLELMERGEHARYHNAHGKPSEISDKARASAAEWHRSEEGRAWHRRHYEQNCRSVLFRREPMRCEHCAADFQGIPKRSKFCSKSCKAAARRASGVDNEERCCRVCGSAFRVNKYWTQECCSARCGRTKRQAAPGQPSFLGARD